MLVPGGLLPPQAEFGDAGLRGAGPGQAALARGPPVLEQFRNDKDLVVRNNVIRALREVGSMTEDPHPAARHSMASEPPRPSGTEGQLRHAGRGFLLSFYAGLRSLKLYPLENATAQKSLDDLAADASDLLETEGELELRVSGDFMFINGTRLRLELENYASLSHIMTMFRTFDIGMLRVDKGIERREWQVFLSVLISLSARQAEPVQLLSELDDRLQAAGVARINLEPAVESQEQLEKIEQAKEVAKRTYSQGVAVTKEVVNSLRMGRSASIKKVKRAVQAIVDQVLNNETSLIGSDRHPRLRRIHVHPFGQRVHLLRRAGPPGRVQPAAALRPGPRGPAARHRQGPDPAGDPQQDQRAGRRGMARSCRRIPGRAR